MITLLVAGLGNYPWPLTRHSIGQLCLEGLASRYAAPLKYSSKIGGWVSDAVVPPLDTSSSSPSFRLVLFKPKVYMNVSGRPVFQAAKSYLSDVGGGPARWMTQVVALHDELDLKPGLAQHKCSGSMRGHRGLLSIQEASKSKSFHRIRIGIGRPDSQTREQKEIADWVLSSLPGDIIKSCQWDSLTNTPGRTLAAVDSLIRGIAQEHMSQS